MGRWFVGTLTPALQHCLLMMWASGRCPWPRWALAVVTAVGDQPERKPEVGTACICRKGPRPSEHSLAGVCISSYVG